MDAERLKEATEVIGKALEVAEEVGVIEEYARCPGVATFDVWIPGEFDPIQITVTL